VARMTSHKRQICEPGRQSTSLAGNRGVEAYVGGNQDGVVPVQAFTLEELAVDANGEERRGHGRQRPYDGPHAGAAVIVVQEGHVEAGGEARRAAGARRAASAGRATSTGRATGAGRAASTGGRTGLSAHDVSLVGSRGGTRRQWKDRCT